MHICQITLNITIHGSTHIEKQLFYTGSSQAEDNG